MTDSYLISNSSSNPHPSWWRNSHFCQMLCSLLFQIQAQSSPVHSGWSSYVTCKHLEPSPHRSVLMSKKVDQPNTCHANTRSQVLTNWRSGDFLPGLLFLLQQSPARASICPYTLPPPSLSRLGLFRNNKAILNLLELGCQPYRISSLQEVAIVASTL